MGQLPPIFQLPAVPETMSQALAVLMRVSSIIAVIGVALYFYNAMCLYEIALKLRAHSAWLAWIPLANLYLLVRLGERPEWWLAFYAFPLVGSVVDVILWMRISQRRGRPDWLGILMFVPVANLVVPGILAFSDAGNSRP